MSDTPSPDWISVKEAVARFEKAWKEGIRPHIEETLASAPEPQRRPLLQELLRVERKLRLHADERPTAEEYSQRFPAHDDVVASVFAPGRASPAARGRVPRARQAHARSTSGSLMASALPVELANHPDYEIVRKLGHGGMGVVWLAHNRLMGRDEVLKVIGQHVIEQPGVLDRFLREIRAVARLRHPNIVSAYTAFHCGNNLVFAMEYVEGLDLNRNVKAHGPLPVGHACYFAYQVALALQHAHEEGMVHRDIKPSNLMLSRKKRQAVIKVLDFGVAKATSEQNAPELGTSVPALPVDLGDQLTRTGEMLGTPDFIAPEQIVDAQQADIRADIYSLGCTLYFLLSGDAPYPDLNLRDVLIAHRALDARRLTEVRADVPSELSALVARMMAKDPGDRLQEPVEVATALLPFFRKPPVTPGSTTLGVAELRPPDATSAAAESTGAETETPSAPAAESEVALAPLESTTPILQVTVADRFVLTRTSKRARSRPRSSRAADAVVVAFTAFVFGLVLLYVTRYRDGAQKDRDGPIDVQSSAEGPSVDRSIGKDAPRARSPQQDTVAVRAPRDLTRTKDPKHSPRRTGADRAPAESSTPDSDSLASAEAGTARANDEQVEAVYLNASLLPGPTQSSLNKPMQWSEIFYLVGVEDDVHQAAELFATQCKRYKRALLELIRLKGDKAGNEAVRATLLQQIDALNGEDAILRARELELRRQENEKRSQHASLVSGPRTDPLRRELAVQRDELSFLQRQARTRSDQINEELGELKRQISELSRGKVGLGEIEKLEVSVDLERSGYGQALRALRAWVDAANRQYADRAKDHDTHAAIASKNRGFSRPVYKLGPSLKFRDIETKLKRHEEWSNSAAAPGRRRGKAKTTHPPPLSLPPPF
jgi:serine/threonine protein kinase